MNNLISYRLLIKNGKKMHERFLLAALNQAWLGRGSCSPNPSVGAIAVRDGNIIAQAWHRGAGQAHAEKRLLKELTKPLKGVTLYSTLEPCNHYGKTGPCVDTIIEYGVERVVYAYADPNPIVAKNNTPSLLKDHGIDVIHCPIAEIDAFYQSYHHWTDTHQPWVTVKLAQSFDGKIAGQQGLRVPISNALCMEFTHLQRLHHDVILTTARTIEVDNPLFNVRLPGMETQKNIAILDRRGTLKRDAHIFSTAKHCHIFHDAKLEDLASYPNSTLHPIAVKEDKLDLHEVLNVLGETLGYHDVWVESGAKLFNELHHQHLVHRTHLYLAPKILGEDATSAYSFPDILNSPCKMGWQAMEDNMIVTFDWEIACSQAL